MTTRLFRRIGLLLALLLAAAGWAPPAAGANTRCVNQGGTGGCFASITAALTGATDGDIILIAGAPGPYFEHLTITKSLNLIGDDRATTIIDGSANGQVISILSAVTVTLANLTVRNGLSGHGYQLALYGGGIHNEALRLTLNNVMVSGNRTGSGSSSTGSGGGGIYSAHGTLTLNHSTVSGNTTGTPDSGGTGGDGGNGGGIYNDGGLLILNDSSVFSNTTGHGAYGHQGGNGGSGGGIYNLSGTLILNRSAIAGNITGFGFLGLNVGGKGGSGGGLFGDLGSLTIDRSTLSGNMTGVGGASGGSPGSSGSGAGLYALNEPVTLTTSTLRGNATGLGLFSSAGGDGGGLFVYQSGPVNLTNVTLAYNAVDGDKQGGAIANNAGAVNVKNSLLAFNHDAFGLDSLHDCSGALNSQGYNVMMEPDCTPPINMATGDQFYVRGAILAPLADNGGPTQTNALLPASPAIDAADNSTCSPTDQRGFARPVFGGIALRCDVGAFELYRFGVRLPLVIK